ncbi:aminoglycoside adenylyltransferase domain-containing protein [Candidatus Amoebophilus asiaticus]|uniref:aminoglycoside adenylyltransferase domain-containing protein n=1 Tax=Candidatus Amoebophilus asiaticus TaxID=281120 RepID=UPI0009FC3C46
MDSVCLDDSQYQAYIILNLCRILYSIMQRTTGSKTAAASWVWLTMEICDRSSRTMALW